MAVGIGEAKLAAKTGIAANRTLGFKGVIKLFWEDPLKKAASRVGRCSGGTRMRGASL